MSTLIALKTNPTVIIPFKPASDFNECQDIFVSLRPETNGVLVESIILKIITGNPLYCANIEIVYMANIPGGFISTNKLIEQHYAVKIIFAQKGKSAFTPYMKNIFTSYYNTQFKDANIIGAFDALKRLQISRDELFKLWVDEEDMLVINGQTIKRIKEHDLFILNYDIPYILSKNTEKTDIAVMVFRSRLPINGFFNMITIMGNSLAREGVIKNSNTLSRAVHYSKSPFDQILDAEGFLFDTDASHIPLSRITFFSFLLAKGLTEQQILNTLINPIMKFEIAPGIFIEDDILEYTVFDTYEKAFEKLDSASSQYFFR